jgi:hypothetical protein
MVRRHFLSFFIVVSATACAELAQITPPTVRVRNDMDNVVATRGVPLMVSEHFMGGAIPRHGIMLYYPGEMYTFQTDENKSYAVLTSNHTLSAQGITQKPIPLWFRARYPNLDWTNIPVP